MYKISPTKTQRTQSVGLRTYLFQLMSEDFEIPKGFNVNNPDVNRGRSIQLSITTLKGLNINVDFIPLCGMGFIFWNSEISSNQQNIVTTQFPLRFIVSQIMRMDMLLSLFNVLIIRMARIEVIRVFSCLSYC